MAQARIGLVGLGVMGANLALNIADRGYPVAIHNRSTGRIAELIDAAGPLAERLVAAETPEALAAALAPPRAIVLMVKAGEAVDATIEALRPHLAEGDILIDAGNADFNDTRRREAELSEAGLRFLGMGVSGGAEGARHGPSIMAGGDPAAWEAVAEVIEAIAARYKGSPCAAHLGPDGAGHFVKTVHNGIEYADMQMIAEVYGLLNSEGRRAEEIGELFEDWNGGPLQSYLVEITAKVLQTRDPETGKPMVELILDAAGQKGTGRWTVIEALKLGESASAIEAAVGARSWSALKTLRETGSEVLAPATARDSGPKVLDGDLERALLAARVIGHAQGFSLLAAASEAFDWRLDLSRTAEIWRAGCIIRSALLDDIAVAFRGDLTGDNLMLAPHFTRILGDNISALRRVVARALLAGQPVPAMAAALGYYDTMRAARGTAALIQAQRDFFGAHGFGRVDAEGEHHGPWTG